VKFTAAIDAYITDMRAQGRLNSDRSETSYRAALRLHGEDVHNRDPRTVNREDVKTTLRRYPHPNTQRRNRSMLVSFFDWLMEEGFRKDNPARQTRAPKARKPQIYRMTMSETRAFLEAARSPRERRIAFLGVCAGLRRDELRLLQGRHFRREGWVWVSADIAKGGRERNVPVMADLAPVVAEICAHVGANDFVLPAQQYADPPHNQRPKDYPDRAGDGKTIWRTTRRIGRRAGIPAPVNPHMMRHAFADHVARFSGLREAQAMLGHADVSTTQGYLGAVTLDDLAGAIVGVGFLTPRPPLERGAAKRLVETVGIEPTQEGFRAVEPFAEVLRCLFASPVLREAARGMA
jgi:site-specific recombinase XerD